MKFKAFKSFVGQTLTSKPITIEAGSSLEQRGSFLIYNKEPICVWNSQVARDYFIWDDNYDERVRYENIILFDIREKSWWEEVPVYDDYGRKSGTKMVFKTARFTPEEVSFMRKQWPEFFEKDSILRFNDHFYVGSDIDKLRCMTEYLTA